MYRLCLWVEWEVSERYVVVILQWLVVEWCCTGIISPSLVETE